MPCWPLASARGLGSGLLSQNALRRRTRLDFYAFLLNYVSLNLDMDKTHGRPQRNQTWQHNGSAKGRREMGQPW